MIFFFINNKQNNCYLLDFVYHMRNISTWIQITFIYCRLSSLSLYIFFFFGEIILFTLDNYKNKWFVSKFNGKGDRQKYHKIIQRETKKMPGFASPKLYTLVAFSWYFCRLLLLLLFFIYSRTFLHMVLHRGKGVYDDTSAKCFRDINIHGYMCVCVCV